MNFGQITAKIERILKDPAILTSEIQDAANKQLRSVTATAAITELITKDSVYLVSGDQSVSMPSDFQHDLLSAYSLTNKRDLTIRPDQRSLYRGYTPSSIGQSVEEVAVSGLEETAILHVRPMSGGEDEIECMYYRFPGLMVNDTDVPELPSQNDIHELCIVSGVVLEKLPETDFAPDIMKMLMGLHGGKLQSGMQILKTMYKNAPKSRPQYRRKTRFY